MKTILCLIHENPGIDAPLICLWRNSPGMIDPDFRGLSLASWLSEWHHDAWKTTCNKIDTLLEEGSIIFDDDGCIYPAGHQGGRA